jgi:large subunit ribosomal protein L18
MPKATGPVYQVAFRRRLSGVTDYKKRLALVKAGIPRMVVRKSGRGVLVQFVEFAPEGDRTLASFASRLLSEKHGWPAKANAPTAYLAGFACAKAAKGKGVTDFVLDVGMNAASKGAVIYAALQGAIDAGLKTNYPQKMIDDDSITGKKIAEYAKARNGSGKQFSAYGADVSKLPELFAQVKAKLQSS